MAIYNSLLWGGIFYGTAGQNYGYNKAVNQGITQNIMGLCFLTVQDMFVNMCFGQVVSIPQFYPVFKREVSNNMYGITSYYFSRVCVACLTFFWYPFILTLLSIWFYDLFDTSFVGFCEWWGILTLTAFVGSSFGFTMGCVLPQHNVAQIVAEMFIIFFGMGAGLM